jgi:hypothetical protein
MGQAASDSVACRHALPALGCNCPEMFVATFVFLAMALASVALCTATICHHDPAGPWGTCVVFWASMAAWTCFRLVLVTLPFDYSLMSYKILCMSVNSVLFLTPLAIGVLIFCRSYFLYHFLRRQRFVFYRAIYLVTLYVYVIIAITFTVANRSDPIEISRAMGLWVAATDLIVLVLSAVPGFQLFCTLLPRIDRESNTGTLLPKITMSLFAALFVARLISSTTTALGVNKLLGYVNNGEIVTANKRVAALFVILVFESTPSVLMMVAVIVLQLNEDRLVRRMQQVLERSDVTIVEYSR